MPARIASPTLASLEEASRILREGALVALPTETVYGLAANALDEKAVQRIFRAKGRPASNPLIVHVESEEAARKLARRWPEHAVRLAAAHWPGPLTLVVEKTDALPDSVTAGGPTVGLRVPAHPVALALLREVGLPLAAPSANRSEEISPTTAQHVADSLGPFVDDLLILDGGPCAVGIESTVVDVTGEAPVVLRPGAITPFPPPGEGERPQGDSGDIARSPGQMLRHYAPKKPLVLVEATFVPLLTDGVLVLPADPVEAAAMLYAELRRLDREEGFTRIVTVEPPDSPEWAAIHDRLRRAATS